MLLCVLPSVLRLRVRRGGLARVDSYGASLALGFWACGVGTGNRRVRTHPAPTLRAFLDRAVGGFALDALGPEGDHDPILNAAVLLEDAALRDGFVSLRVG